MTDQRRISKTLSYWLRHRPDAAAISLDEAGWARVADVLAALARAGLDVSAALLREVVAANDKQRFELSPDDSLIRARQGHSLEVDLGWPEAEPPDFLYHGTVARFLASILAEGLRKMSRHHVHLSPDPETARIVGRRRGEPVILRIAARRMAEAGHGFRLSGNGVWLVEEVPPQFLECLATAGGKA